MKKPTSKQDIRRQIASQVNEFLAGGGSIQQIPQGVSGKDQPLEGGQRPINQLFDRPRQPRTPIPEVLAALDERKQKKATKPAGKKKKPTLKEKIIYDDFGEPLRRIQVEE